MSLFSKSCAEAARLMSESQDAKLPLPARLGLRLHLALCSRCRRYRSQLEQMRSVFNAYSEKLATERLPEEARRQIVRQLECKDQ